MKKKDKILSIVEVVIDTILLVLLLLIVVWTIYNAGKEG